MNQAIRFGTDGIRGPAGTFPLDAAGARRIGAAVAAWAGAGSRIVLGRDTRQSGPALAQDITAGLVDGGCEVLDGGVMPTAAVSCAVASHRARGGVVITASHNPWQDNGVKVLTHGGGKLVDPAPLAAFLDAFPNDPPRPGGGRCSALADPLAPWLTTLPQIDLSGLSILLDCAHGAAAQVAPDLLRRLGASVIAVGCSPDGHNINADVGALHPPTDLGGADLGIVLDGDADRLLLIDPVAGPVDGDDLLWLLAGEGPVVGTIMSNAGLEEALQGRLVRVQVGDRFVAEGMSRTGASVGGEPSGHVLLRGGPPTSCGLYTALEVLRRSAPAGSLRPSLPLTRLDGWTRWPQAHRNVESTWQLDQLSSLPAAQAAGLRVVVRYSGTEPVVRVMVEGRQPHVAQAWADRIAAELLTDSP